MNIVQISVCEHVKDAFLCVQMYKYACTDTYVPNKSCYATTLLNTDWSPPHHPCVFRYETLTLILSPPDKSCTADSWATT